MANSHIISQEAVNLLISRLYNDPSTQWIPNDFITDSHTAKSPNAYDVDLEHFCSPVVHPTTGETITQYRRLAKDPATSDIWQKAFGKEFGRMVQSDNKT